ncbi:hypothetical protein ACHWQZ_G008219 [Mnemiopsis leidyi]
MANCAKCSYGGCENITPPICFSASSSQRDMDSPSSGFSSLTYSEQYVTTRSEVPSPEKATSNTTVPHFERPLLDIVLVDEAEEGDVIEHDRGDGHDSSLGFHNGMDGQIKLTRETMHPNADKPASLVTFRKLSRTNSIGAKNPTCCDFLCSTILKGSLLYNVETVFNLVFIVHESLVGNYILSGVGVFLTVLSTVMSYIVALNTHLHIYPPTTPTVQSCLPSVISVGDLRKVFMMNPWVQIFWIYRQNRKNQGLRQYLYYRLCLTYFVAHWIETFGFVLLRLSHPAPIDSMSFISSVFPVVFNILGIVVASIDWERCKRSKSQSRHDFMLECRILGIPINWQTLIKFVIYISMVTSRCMTLSILMFSIEWSDPELPYLVFLCHVTIFLFMFGSLWLRLDFVNFGNMLKTVVLSFNQTFFNQMDCFLKIPFNLYFIPPYVLNCVSIVMTVIFHFLFSSEAFTDNRTIRFWVFTAMGFSSLALYALAGILALLYKLFWCPDVLKVKMSWKFDKIALNEL